MNIGLNLFLTESKEIWHFIQTAMYGGENCIAPSGGEKWKLNLTKNYKNILRSRFMKLPKDHNFSLLVLQSVVYLPVISKQQ